MRQLLGAFSSLLTAGYITLYNQGVNFFGQPNLFLFNIDFWPLVMLRVPGCVYWPRYQIYFGQHGGLGVAQAQYAQTGRPQLPQPTKHTSTRLYSVMEWRAAVGPEAPLVFLTGGVGSFVSERLNSRKMMCKY